MDGRRTGRSCGGCCSTTASTARRPPRCRRSARSRASRAVSSRLAALWRTSSCGGSSTRRRSSRSRPLTASRSVAGGGDTPCVTARGLLRRAAALDATPAPRSARRGVRPLGGRRRGVGRSRRARPVNRRPRAAPRAACQMTPGSCARPCRKTPARRTKALKNAARRARPANARAARALSNAALRAPSKMTAARAPRAPCQTTAARRALPVKRPPSS